MDRYDIVIVGSGAAGLTGAMTARGRGARVAMLESRKIGVERMARESDLQPDHYDGGGTIDADAASGFGYDTDHGRSGACTRTTMKTVVVDGAGDVRLEVVPDPVLDGGAIVRVEAAGVCAADRMIHAGDSPWELDFPFVLGHELVATVTAIDSDAATAWGLAIGDRVEPEVMVPCDVDMETAATFAVVAHFDTPAISMLVAWDEILSGRSILEPLDAEEKVASDKAGAAIFEVVFELAADVAAR